MAASVLPLGDSIEKSLDTFDLWDLAASLADKKPIADRRQADWGILSEGAN